MKSFSDGVTLIRFYGAEVDVGKHADEEKISSTGEKSRSFGKSLSVDN